MENNNSLKKTGTTVLSCVVIILILMVVGTMLIISTGFISQEAISKNVEESVNILYEEGSYPEIWKENKASRLDNFTDALMISTVYTKSREDSFVYDSIMATFTLYGSSDPLETLHKWFSGENEEEYRYIPYGRYWHGYMVILKPLLMFFNISTIRLINRLLQILLVLCILIMCLKKKYIWLIPPLLLAWISISPVAVSISLQFSSVFYITGLAVLILVAIGNKMSLTMSCILFELIGILVAFFDLLTYPAVSLGIPLIVMTAVSSDEEDSAFFRLIRTAACSVAWAFGYAVMWASKWVITSAITGEDVFADAIATAKFRTSNSYNENVYTWASTISANVKVLFSNPFALALIITVLIFFCYLFITKRWKFPNVMDLIIIILASLIPIVWYMLLKNHSSIHYWMTFRELSVTVFGVSCILFLGFKKKEAKTVRRRKGRRYDASPTSGEENSPIDGKEVSAKHGWSVA